MTRSPNILRDSCPFISLRHMVSLITQPLAYEPADLGKGDIARGDIITSRINTFLGRFPATHVAIGSMERVLQLGTIVDKFTPRMDK